MAPQHVKHESNRLGRAQLSLRALFALMFVAACFSRFVGHYGIGVVVILGWFALAGAIAGLVVASAVAFVDLIANSVSRSWPGWSLSWNRFARIAATGAVGGLIVQGLAVMCVFSLLNEPPANILDSWMKGTKALAQISFREPIPMQCLMLSPALLSALSFSTARAIANRKEAIGQCIPPTGCLLATLFGLAPLVLLIIWLLFLPKPPPPPPGAFHENMLGLLPIAVPIWCVMAAAIGGALGVVAGSLLALVSLSQRNPCHRTLLWCAVIFLAMFITEASTHGWTGKVLEWWHR